MEGESFRNYPFFSKQEQTAKEKGWKKGEPLKEKRLHEHTIGLTLENHVEPPRKTGSFLSFRVERMQKK